MFYPMSIVSSRSACWVRKIRATLQLVFSHVVFLTLFFVTSLPETSSRMDSLVLSRRI